MHLSNFCNSLALVGKRGCWWIKLWLLAVGEKNYLRFLREQNRFLRDSLDLWSFSVVLAVGDSLKDQETNKVMASKNRVRFDVQKKPKTPPLSPTS